MNPTHFNLIHLHHLSHACTLITCTTHTLYRQLMYILHRTPEGTPTGLVHTHLVTSSGVQLVLLNDELHHFSMAIPSCPVDHGVAIIVSAMQQGLHFRSQVADDIDMATQCSKVQGIGPILQKGKHNK